MQYFTSHELITETYTDTSISIIDECINLAKECHSLGELIRKLNYMKTKLEAKND